MKVELENKGAKDIIKNWSVGRKRHFGERFNFLGKLKQNGINKELTSKLIQQSFQTFLS
jgi:hypothetical protein